MKKTIPFLLTFVLLIGLSSLGLKMLKGDSLSIVLPSESGPRAVWYAQNLLTFGTPSINGGIPVSLTQDSLYTGLLAGGLFLDVDPSSLLVLLGLLFSLSTVLFLNRYAQRLGLSVIESTVIFVSMATLPAFVPMILSGTSGPLFTLFLTLGVIAYFRTQHETGYGFSFSVLLPFALASALHVEALLMIVVLGVGNVVCGLINRDKQSHAAAVCFDVLNGVLIAAVFLLPAAAYHLNVIRVPWPRNPDAWLALGTAAEPGTAALGELYTEHFLQCLNNLGALSLWPGVILLAGLVASVILTVKRQSVTAIHYIVLLVIAPVLAAAASVGLGGDGAESLMRSLQPVVFLLGCFVLYRAIQSLVPLKSLNVPVVGKLETGSLGFSVLLFIGLCIGLVQVRTSAKIMAGDLISLSDAVIEAGQDSGPAGTDWPAWLRLYGSSEVVDIAGRTDLRTLAIIGAARHLDRDGWRQLAQEREISTFLIVEEGVHESLIESGLVEEDGTESPWVYSSRLP